MIDITGPKVLVPTILFALLSPGLLLSPSRRWILDPSSLPCSRLCLSELARHQFCFQIHNDPGGPDCSRHMVHASDARRSSDCSSKWPHVLLGDHGYCSSPGSFRRLFHRVGFYAWSFSPILLDGNETLDYRSGCYGVLYVPRRHFSSEKGRALSRP